MEKRMKERIKQKINQKRREITLIIISTIVLLFYFSGFSIGKAFYKTNISANAHIARPILKVDNTPEVHIKTVNDIGTYEFKVKNYDEMGNITQVDLEYNIEILTEIDENILIKLFKENEEINLENNKTEKYELATHEMQEHNYKIEIACKKENIKEIEEIMQEIQIKVYAEQKELQGDII